MVGSRRHCLVLVVVASGIGTNTPDTHASMAKIVTYYHKHRNAELVSAYLTELAVFIGVPFFWYLREYLVGKEPTNRRLSGISMAGLVIFAMGGTLGAGLSFVLYDSVNHISDAGLQTLNALGQDLTNMMTGVGVALILVPIGIAVIRSAALPRWIGWLGAVIGVAALAIFFIGFIGIGLWILITSIVILLRANRPETSTLAPAAATTAQ